MGGSDDHRARAKTLAAYGIQLYSVNQPSETLDPAAAPASPKATKPASTTSPPPRPNSPNSKNKSKPYKTPKTNAPGGRPSAINSFKLSLLRRRLTHITDFPLPLLITLFMGWTFHQQTITVI